VHLRREHPVFRRRRFFAGAPERGGESDLRDIAWLSPDGQHMSDAQWQEELARALMVFLNGDAIAEPDLRGEEIVDDSFLVLFNAQPGPTQFTLPDADYGESWTVVVDTDHQLEIDAQVPHGATITLAGRSTAVLVRPPAPPAPPEPVSPAPTVRARSTVRAPGAATPAPATAPGPTDPAGPA
jgi:glycogen operon protein